MEVTLGNSNNKIENRYEKCCGRLRSYRISTRIYNSLISEIFFTSSETFHHFTCGTIRWEEKHAITYCKQHHKRKQEKHHIYCNNSWIILYNGDSKILTQL